MIDPMVPIAKEHSRRVNGHSVYVVVDKVTKKVVTTTTVSYTAAYTRAARGDNLVIAEYSYGEFQRIISLKKAA